MKIGLLAYMSNNGLSIQTYYGYYKHLKPTKTLVADLSPLNNQKTYPERYTDNPIGNVVIVRGFPQTQDIDDFCKDLDVIILAENPLNPYLYTRARQLGIKVFCHYNYEFLDALLDNQLPRPDMMLAPSVWNIDEIHNLCHEWGVNFAFLNMPVDRKQLPFKQRTQAKKFLHIAGHKTTGDRNGTDTVLAAISRVKSRDVEFIIRSQDPLPFVQDSRVKVIVDDTENYWDIYGDADVLLMPRRYGGLCLPLQESMSLGMIPLVSNVSPQNSFLTYPMTVRARIKSVIHVRIGNIPLYDVDPTEYAERIDFLANAPSEDIANWSDLMDTISEEISWDTMVPEYLSVFEKCLNARNN